MIERLRHPLVGYVFTAALVAVCTGIIPLIRWAADVGNISTVYLLAVIASAVWCGRGPAIAASVAAFLAYNFFFIMGCRRAGEIAAWVQKRFPQVNVRLLNPREDESDQAALVRATPTYFLNGVEFSLGNPSEEQLVTVLQSTHEGIS